MRVGIVPATMDHAMHVATHARPEDVAELWACSHATPLHAIKRGMRSSSMTFAGLIDDEPIAVFGVVPASLLTGIGCPWMVATPELERVHKTLLRCSRVGLAAMAEVYPHLVNFVDARNDKAIRWLRWLGFTIHAPITHGIERRPFHPFELRTA